MPFDGAGSFGDVRLQKIDRVIDLLRTPNRWCKGTERNRAGQYCIRGALIAVGGWELLQPVIADTIPEVSGRRFRRIEEFNDDPHTTHSDVVEVLQRTRQRIVAGSLYGPVSRAPLRRRLTFGQWISAFWQTAVG
jgi:hypothetical protein